MGRKNEFRLTITICDLKRLFFMLVYIASFNFAGILNFRQNMKHWQRQNIQSSERALKDLIESNLRQRVLGNTNPVKLGRCFEFLNNWYGFKHGASSFQGNQHIEVNGKLFNSPNNTEPSTQKELAESYGISQQTMNNYMRMASMIPELEDV